MAAITGPGPSLRAQWLGEKLRNLRKDKGFSLRYAGEYLQRDAGTLSRNENGELPVRRGDLLALMDLYGVSDERERSWLEQLRDEAWQKGWWDQHREDLGSGFINVPWLESRATRICSYQQMLVEGLLQTRDYAEVVIRNAEKADTGEDQINRWIDLRLDRQRILTQDQPPQLSVILEESALHRQIGEDAVWAAQLQHLVSVSEGNDIELRIMPFSQAPHAGHLGGFVRFEMPDPYPEVAYVDTLAGPLFIEEPTAERFSQAWQDLYETALDPVQSNALVAKLLEDME